MRLDVRATLGRLLAGTLLGWGGGMVSGCAAWWLAQLGDMSGAAAARGLACVAAGSGGLCFVLLVLVLGWQELSRVSAPTPEPQPGPAQQ